MSVNRGTHRIVLLLLSFLLLSVVAHSESQVEGGGGTIGYNSQEMLMVSISNDSEFNAITSENRLLMPIWAYKSAAGYLLFISVMGLILNTIVVLVLINDKQVYVIQFKWFKLKIVFKRRIIFDYIENDAIKLDVTQFGLLRRNKRRIRVYLNILFFIRITLLIRGRIITGLRFQ